MSLTLLLLTLLPIAIILCMLIFFRKPADISGIIGWIAISVVAYFAFSTSIEVIYCGQRPPVLSDLFRYRLLLRHRFCRWRTWKKPARLNGLLFSSKQLLRITVRYRL